MDSIQASNNGGVVEKEKEVGNNNNNSNNNSYNYASMVDPFLVEALQNPRHRLTVLRMELDIQKFLQNPEQLQFEFQHFPTSYLRLAAHRVAQHYGLQTMVLDNLIDGPGNKIVVRKTETKFPSVRLSDVPAKQPENSKHEQVKFAIRRRPNMTSSGDASDMGTKNSTLRSVEERKEEYDRARARIFRSPGSCSTEEMVSLAVANGKGPCPTKETVACRDVIGASEKLSSVSDMGSSSRVAIFKDREKDRADPDYDRSYERYVKNFPTSQRILMPFNMPKFQASFLQYEASFPQMGQIPRAQPSLNYGPSPDPSISHYCTMGTNHASRDAIYMQWPSPAMMYAHSYGPFRQSVLQATFCQQPLSFDCSQNH